MLLGDSGESVVITDVVLQHFLRYQQLRSNQTEAGGQLFGRIHDQTIMIEEATGPRRSDKRTRYSYIPDRRAEQREIDDRFSDGLHFLGDWHTHPEPIPNPSGIDLNNMRECVKKSRRAVSGFLLIIVGSDSLPRALHASLHDGKEALSLTISDERSTENPSHASEETPDLNK